MLLFVVGWSRRPMWQLLEILQVLKACWRVNPKFLWWLRVMLKGPKNFHKQIVGLERFLAILAFCWLLIASFGSKKWRRDQGSIRPPIPSCTACCWQVNLVLKLSCLCQWCHVLVYLREIRNVKGSRTILKRCIHSANWPNSHPSSATNLGVCIPLFFKTNPLVYLQLCTSFVSI